MLGLIALLALGAPPAEPLALYARARATIETHGDTLWPGFADAPFRMLLNDGEREFLVCGDTPDGFEPAGTDPVTGCSLPRATPGSGRTCWPLSRCSGSARS